MPNTFFGLTIASSGINASNIAINTVAHNISNVKTDGYTKQTVNTTASDAIRVYSSYGTVGTGVTVTSIDQLRSSYYDTKYWDNNSNAGQYATLENYSTLIEDYLDEFNISGFTKEYENLFDAIDEMVSDPSSEVARNQFLNYAQSICEYFNTLSANLSNVQKSANDEVQLTTDSINSIAEQIASLNKQINVIELSGGGNANDLRDRRALLVDELSGYVNTTVSERDFGNGKTEFKVSINGQTLVDGNDYNQLICEPRETGNRRNATDIDGLYDLRWDTGLSFNLYSTSLRGALKAAVDIRDGCNDSYEITALVNDAGEYFKNADGKVIDIQDLSESEYNAQLSAGYKPTLAVISDSYRNSDYMGIPYYQSQMNEFINAIADAFNSVIAKGDLNGAEVPDLFVAGKGNSYITAANVVINVDIINDTSLLPYSYNNATGAANSDMAEDLYKIQNKDIINNGTFSEYLSSIVTVISVDTSRAKSFASTYSNIQATIKNQRLSVSSVDEDEETVDMVKYRESYNLSSKVISVMQEIYNKLIEETGV